MPSEVGNDNWTRKASKMRALFIFTKITTM